ncbi:response regulator transcription factor [Nocardia sp. CDC159]|uniref:Response regulator transcription factor n=1 Tax=Nocardia pulmonis TaxID=2951408 RepID=A0A9X2EII9_9NOCA|nr:MULTISPECIES: response regulator transcription factor [Nocardia]MCM6778711.1 response regulator transcription factor [Nocardia pulmonis]MCM6791600.1 response regulator transcription factor [Nocardia sp. CDC159]
MGLRCVEADQRSVTHNILLAESNKTDRDSLSERLARHGYTVTAVDTAGDALERYHAADLVMLDLDLPDLEGIQLCRAIREASVVPIIIVTARESDLDRVLGLRAGADDYITKPYGTRELIARVEAVLRRFHPAQWHPTSAPADRIQHGSLSVDVANRRVELVGRPVRLTRKEFDLLVLLVANPGQVIERSTIAEEIWHGSMSGRTIDTHINSLRRKIGNGEWIATVRGIGFRFVA